MNTGVAFTRGGGGFQIQIPLHHQETSLGGGDRIYLNLVPYAAAASVVL